MLSAALNAQAEWKVFVVHQLEKKLESDSNDIVSLCHYLYCCGVDSAKTTSCLLLL